MESFIRFEAMTMPDPQKKIMKAYNSSIKFLASRTRSVKEVRDNLYKKKFKNDIIDKTISILEEENLLNDTVFASEFVSTREKVKPKSKFALKYELKKKGVSDSIIDKAISKIDENKSALVAVETKVAAWQKLDKKTMKNKMMNFLKNRGFNWEIFSTTYETICNDLENQEGNK